MAAVAKDECENHFSRGNRAETTATARCGVTHVQVWPAAAPCSEAWAWRPALPGYQPAQPLQPLPARMAELELQFSITQARTALV